MSKLFIGLLFVFLNFSINLDTAQVGLFPDFVGYILMVIGLAEMSPESNRFARARHWAIGMSVYTGLLYLFNLLGISASLGPVATILAVASTVVSLFISYNIVSAVREIETRDQIDLYGKSLMWTWKVLAIFNCAVCLVILVPVLNLVVVVALVVVAILFLISFNATKNRYNDLKNPRHS